MDNASFVEDMIIYPETALPERKSQMRDVGTELLKKQDPDQKVHNNHNLQRAPQSEYSLQRQHL